MLLVLLDLFPCRARSNLVCKVCVPLAHEYVYLKLLTVDAFVSKLYFQVLFFRVIENPWLQVGVISPPGACLTIYHAEDLACSLRIGLLTCVNSRCPHALLQHCVLPSGNVQHELNVDESLTFPESRRKPFIGT